MKILGQLILIFVLLGFGSAAHAFAGLNAINTGVTMRRAAVEAAM